MTTTATQEKRAGGTTAAEPSASTAMTAPVQSGPIAMIEGVDVPSIIRERDNEAMLASFMGEVVEGWFYEIEIGGKKIEGVGVIGAEAFQRIQAEHGCPITVVPYGTDIREATQNDERGVRATITMRDARTRRESIGTAFYPHYFLKKNGERKFDDKADRKALSVAKRNAILDLVPQEEILAVLKARKQLISHNAARIAELTKRAIAAAPEAAVMSPARRGDISGEAYAPAPLTSTRQANAGARPNPAARTGPPATEEQIEQLLNLIENPAVNEKTKDAVTTALKGTITQTTALKWVEQIEEYIASKAVATTTEQAPQQLPLNG